MAFTIPNNGAAAYPLQAAPDAVDIDILVAALNGNGVISGCAVTTSSLLTVSVAVGTIEVNSAQVAVASGTVTCGTADATNPRIDLVAVDNSGTKSIVAGTAATIALMPAIPANSVILAAIYIPALLTTIVTGDITDKRCLLGNNNVNIVNTAPSLVLTDTTASAKSLTIAVDANIAQLRESAGASGSLMVLDLANNRVGIGTASPASVLLHIKTSGSANNLLLDNNGGTAITGLAVATSGTIKGYWALASHNGDFSTSAVIGDMIFRSEANNILFNQGSGAATMAVVGSQVSIGHASPATLLDLLGADNTTVQTIKINATQANITAADVFMDFRSTTGSEATIAGTAVAGVIAYNTFTGSHYTQIDDRDGLEVGMLLEATGEKLGSFPERRRPGKNGGDPEEAFQASGKPHLVKAKISRTKGSQAVYGVYGGTDKEGRDMVLASGSGPGRVAKTNRDVKIGDYLIASDIPGVMELQADNIHRNNTAARAMEPIVWAKGEVVRSGVACIYLGG